MPPTSNFLQFNPGAANQESDATYLADAQRLGGFASQQLLPAVLLNKIIFQCAQFIYAFTQMKLAKGYSMMDTNAGTLQGQLANVRTNADERALLTVQAFNANPVFDFTNTDAIQITMNGNITPTFAGLGAGRRARLILIQDGIGGRTVAYPGTMGTIFSQPDGTAGSTNIQEIQVTSDSVLHPAGPMTVS
jgi:hypothetical protein